MSQGRNNHKHNGKKQLEKNMKYITWRKEGKRDKMLTAPL